MTGPLPLDGILIVALEQAVAVPFATRQLADLGARVIKIERPETGDFARHYDRPVLAPPARGPGCTDKQDRARGTGRSRPPLRPDRPRPVQLLRVAEPG